MEMLRELAQLLPEGFQVYVLFDSWYASNQIMKFCRRQRLACHLCGQVQSQVRREKLSQWNRTLKHQRYNGFS